MVQKSNRSFVSRSMIGFLYACGAGMMLAQPAAAQSGKWALTDLSAFRQPGGTWQIAGDVSGKINKPNALETVKGSGVLVNLPGKKQHGQDLYTSSEYGDIDLELDYMMAAGSNSGIYFQGRYELQLFDSWGNPAPKAADNGGIYERWDDSKPEGQQGYQGYAPRMNASKAPGLWQHLKVSFQAPRFDASGKKIENARIIRAVLNGVVIHENIELEGNTRGGNGAEAAKGPLRIQGDHGAVAFRNITITDFSTPKPSLTGLEYTVYKAANPREFDPATAKAEAKGTGTSLTANAGPFAHGYQLRYTGKLSVQEAGEYNVGVAAQGGAAALKVNGKEVAGFGGNGRGKVTLPAGASDVEVLYARTGDWGAPSLNLLVSGKGLRETVFGDPAQPDDTDPILLEADQTTLLRSFMDVPGAAKVTHAVSVGSPEKVHYTYDLDNGMLIQAWRGRFLETTPMWNDRGNGTSRPIGALQRFGNPSFALNRLADADKAWSADSAGTSFRPKGYVLDEKDRPTFRYQIFGSNVSDAIRILPDGSGFTRDLEVSAPAGDLYAKLAEGANIEQVEKDLYVVDGKSFYLRLTDAGGAKPVVRTSGNKQELIVPVRGKLSYSILF